MSGQNLPNGALTAEGCANYDGLSQRLAFDGLRMNPYTVQGPHLDWAQVNERQLAGERLPLFINGHPYTGDHIICAGMYRELAKKWQLNIFTRPGLHQTVCLLTQGIADVDTIEISEPQHDAYAASLKNAVVLRMGDHLDTNFDHNNFDVIWYSQARIEFRHRWDSFQVPVIEQISKPNGEYVFVHDRPELNKATLPFAGERPRPEAHIFSHRDLILGARTLHCVSSSFAAFADSLDLSGKDLNFYPFGREIPKHKHNWKIW